MGKPPGGPAPVDRQGGEEPGRLVAAIRRGDWHDPSWGRGIRWDDGQLWFLKLIETEVPQVLEGLYNDVHPLILGSDSWPASVFDEWCRKWGLTDSWASDAAVENLVAWVVDSHPPRRPLTWQNLWRWPGAMVSYTEPPLPSIEPWVPTDLSWREYRAKAVERLGAALDHYHDDIEARLEASHLERVPKRRERFGDPMVWLVKRHVLEWSYKKIAKEQKETNEREGRKPEKGRAVLGPTSESVRKRVGRVRDQIGLTRRQRSG